MKMMKKLLLGALLCVSLAACTTTKVVEEPPGSGNYSTNVVLDPKFTNAVGTIGAVNDATAPINPFHGLISIGLGAVAAGAAWWAKYKNTRRQLETVIAGVESVGGAAVKTAIHNQAVADKIEGSLSKTVKQVTGD